MKRSAPLNYSVIEQACKMHDELIEALVNSNIELAALLHKVASVTDREMITLRMDANARVINKARGE